MSLRVSILSFFHILANFLLFEYKLVFIVELFFLLLTKDTSENFLLSFILETTFLSYFIKPKVILLEIINSKELIPSTIQFLPSWIRYMLHIIL